MCTAFELPNQKGKDPSYVMNVRLQHSMRLMMMRIDVKLNSSLFFPFSLSLLSMHILLVWSLNMCAGTLIQNHSLADTFSWIAFWSFEDSLIDEKKVFVAEKVNTSSCISVQINEKLPSYQQFEHDRLFLTVTSNVVWTSTCTFISDASFKVAVAVRRIRIESRLNNTKMKCNPVNNSDLKCRIKCDLSVKTCLFV